MRVPNLIGRVYNEISSDELKDFVRVQVNYENNEATAGTVIRQDPIGDRMVKSGTKTLTLTISLGPKQVEIPQVSTTDTEEKVVSLLRAKGFNPSVQRVSSNTVAAGYVVKTNPSYPDQAPEGSVVNVYVSTGSEPVPDRMVPNVEGAAQADAIAKLTEQGFVVNQENIVTINHPEYGAGIVINQTPDPNTQQQPGTEVILTVSSGYRDVSNVVVTLPSTDQAVDLKVYIDGREAVGAQYTTDLQGLLPSVIRSVTLSFTEQKESYTVTIQSFVSGTNEGIRYIEYAMNGLTGTYSITKQGALNDQDVAAPTDDDHTTTTTRRHDD